MDVTPYVAALREDLISAAAAGDEQTQRTAALLAAAIEPAARLAVMNAMADLAAEVTEELGGDRVVEVRLDGRQVRVAVSEPTPPSPPHEPPPPPQPPPTADVGDISRITLRLVDQIKNRAEQAAMAQGMSLNAWIAQAVQGALHGAPPQDWGDWSRGRKRDNERRLRGWVQG
jgi:HicB-like protein involved in pilus formation